MKKISDTNEKEIDFPKEIEYKGKKITIDEKEQRQFMLEAGKRVIAFARTGPMELKINGNLFVIMDLKDIVKFNPDYEGTTIQIRKPGLKLRKGLVGMGGVYYEPKNIGAPDSDYVIDAWNWLFTRETFPKEDFENYLEGGSVMRWIITGSNQTATFHIMSMAVDLKILFDKKIDVSEKVSEIISKIRGNLRKFNKMKDKEKAFALLHLNDMTLTVADMLAETRIATVANSFGLDVTMKKTPDVLIDGVRVEAKFDRRFLMKDSGFENKVTKGLNQGGELIAIFTGSFEIKKIKNKKLTWLGTEDLYTALLMALEFCKDGKKSILLFTGTSQGEIGRVAIIRE